MTTPTFAVGDRVTFNATTRDTAYGSTLDDLTQFNGSTGTIGRMLFSDIVGVIWDANQAIDTAGPGSIRPSGRACFANNLLPFVEPTPKVGDIVEYQHTDLGDPKHNGARGVAKRILPSGRAIEIDWVTYPGLCAPPRYPFIRNLKVASPADLLKDAAANLVVDLPGDIDLPALRERLLTLITPALADDQTEVDAITIARAYERYITTGATS